jgi:hypothetical protein
MNKDRTQYFKNYYDKVGRVRRGHKKSNPVIVTGLSKKHTAYNKTRHDLMRRKALEMIQGSTDLKCIKCGCKEYNLLEINHINGGGRQEFISLKGENLYALILRGKRKTEDLDLRCKLCNNLYFIEKKFGKKISDRYKLEWK